MFPKHIAATTMRPDLVLYSNSKRIQKIFELTCLMEENFAFRNIEKTSKYADPVTAFVSSGWNTYLFAVKVGARGFESVSLRNWFAKLGIYGKHLREAFDESASVSSRSSFWILIKRAEVWDHLNHVSPKIYKSLYRPTVSPSRQVQKGFPNHSLSSQPVLKSKIPLPSGLRNIGICQVVI